MHDDRGACVMSERAYGWGRRSLAAEFVRFLAGGSRWTIMELDDDEPAESLTMVWLFLFGCEPDFSPAGDAATGFHVALDERERGLIVSRSANNDATGAAARLSQPNTSSLPYAD